MIVAVAFSSGSAHSRGSAPRAYSASSSPSTNLCGTSRPGRTSRSAGSAYTAEAPLCVTM